MLYFVTNESDPDYGKLRAEYVLAFSGNLSGDIDAVELDDIVKFTVNA